MAEWIPDYYDLPPEARIAFLIATACMAWTFITILRAWLGYESARRLAGPAPIRRVEVPMDRSAHEQALRRELYTAHSRIADLTGQLNASRQIGRQQERAGLALHTLRAEIDQTQRHAVLQLGPGHDRDPTVRLDRTVVPFTRRLLADVS